MDEITLKMLELSGRGYCCSQIMFLMALELQGKTNPDLVRAMAGLCHGIGFSGNACGALTGGACLLSYYAGRGSDSEEVKDGFAAMLAGLTRWFAEQIGPAYGGINCSGILAKSPDRSACREIVRATYEKVLQLLVEHGCDPGQ